MSCDPFVGYHGTLSDRAVSIKENGFRYSEKPIEWLGAGVYFFTKFSDAEYWVRQELRRFPETAALPVVIVVDIKITRHELLDLDEPDTQLEFQGELKAMYDSMFGDGELGAPKFKDERERRCFWCNCYMQKHPELKAIALSFPIQRFDAFGFPVKRRQMCVVDAARICMPPKKVEVLS